MDMKIVGISVAVLVSLVVLAGVLMPVLEDATSTTATFTNEGVPFAEPDSGTHTIVLDSTGMKTDGESVTGLQMLYGNSVSILYCENNVVRWSTNGEVQVIGNTNLSGQRRVIGDTDNETITFTISGNSVTGSCTTTPNVTFSDVLAYPTADESAKYRQGTQHYYTDDTDLIIAGGFTNHPEGGQMALVMTGTVDNLTADYVWYYSVPATVEDIDVQTSNITTNLNQVDKILVTMDITATGDNYEVTYTQFLSEATGTYQNPGFVGSASSEILSAIPLIVIAALIIGVVAIVVRSRLD